MIPSGALRQRLEALRQKYAQDRRIAHAQAIVAAMVQLDEVEAYAEEQEAALLHDRSQLATIDRKP
jgi:AmiR/NasT family two-component response regulator